MSVGHDEYWSGAQRANVEAARDAGVNLMFLSGNEVYWHTRYEPSADAGRTPYRTLVCYKETWADAEDRPRRRVDRHVARPALRPHRAPARARRRTASPAPLYMSNNSDLPVTVSAQRGQAAALAEHQPGLAVRRREAALAPHTVGYESEEDLDNGLAAAGSDPPVHDHRRGPAVPAGLRQPRLPARPPTT